MNLDQLDNYLASIPRQIDDAVPDIIAETATEYFKGSFTKKAFDGNPWEKPKTSKSTGSLLVESGALLNSIRPAVVNKNEVIISAGDSKVEYAQIHNEGGTTHPKVTANMRKWAWATGNRGIATTSKTTLDVTIPQRQFMGESRELNRTIMQRIDGFLKSIIH